MDESAPSPTAACPVAGPGGARPEIVARLAGTARGGVSRVVVVAGPSGVGKTWIAAAVRETLAAEGAFTGTGKYGEAHGSPALAPVMAALSGVVRAALDRHFEVQTALASLTQALGVQLEILLSAGLVVPGVTAHGTLAALIDRRRGLARIIAATTSLLGWLDHLDRPLLLVIDDWQRAPPEGDRLIRAIASASPRRRLTLMLTQREADIPVFEDVAVAMERVAVLDPEEVTDVLAARLGGVERARPLVAFLGSALPRLPFDLLAVADGLVASGALRETGDGWHLDTERAGQLAFDAVSRIAALDADAFALATALALWGDSAPAEPLALALGGMPGAALDALLVRCVVMRAGGRIAFAHDRLRKAVLDRAGEPMLALVADAMADRLATSATDAESADVALALRLAGDLARARPALWRDRFAIGARDARGRGDARAGAFAEAAYALRAAEPGGDADAERLILREAVLAAADRDDPATETRARALIATARSPTEACDDHETAAVALRFAGRSEAAWRIACEGLRGVGIAPPGDVTRRWQVAVAALRWLLVRPERRRAALPHDPPPPDAFAGLAAAAASIGYHRDPRAAAVIGFRAARIASRATLQSSYWQSVDAFLFAALGARARAAAAGARALACFDRQRVQRAASLYQAIFFGRYWRDPLIQHRARFPEVTRIGLDEGDPVMASYGQRMHVMTGWRTGGDLDALLEEAVAARAVLRGLGEGSFIDEMEAMVALLEGLTGRTAWNPDVWRRDVATRNHVIDLELSNLAGDWHETVRRAEALVPLRRDYDIQADAVVLRFHETVARLRCGLRPRRGDVRFVRQAAALNPHDHAAKLLLIAAERARVRRGAALALPRYQAAVEAAAAADSRLDASLAATCAADAAHAAGDAALATRWRHRAATILGGWGMRAPVRPPATPEHDTLAALEARAVAAERADQAKDRLLVHVGHELRTPLQALQSSLDLAVARGEPADPAALRAILASFAAVVDDLDIVGGAGAARDGAVRDVDLADLLRSEMRLWDGTVETTLDLASTVPPVDVAADRVRQVVRNLLSNAVKYGAGSAVRVTLAGTVADGMADMRVSVADGGPGLPPGAAEALFEPFARGRFAGDGRGVGLGLALSRRIAERLGGTLVAGASAAGGAVFTLTFAAPLARAEPVRAVAVASVRILLVEDAALIRQLLAESLARAGHAVSEAADVAAARAAWRPGRFDLAIVDMGLPDGEGTAVIADIRATDAAFPVIVLTASTDAAADAIARDDARVRVLRKPASAETIAATMAVLLDAPVAAALPALDLADLHGAARREVVARARGVLAAPCAASARELHELSGLAAQFGWTDAAHAVDGLSAALLAGAAPGEWTGRLAAIVDRIAG